MEPRANNSRTDDYGTQHFFRPGEWDGGHDGGREGIIHDRMDIDDYLLINDRINAPYNPLSNVYDLTENDK